jgi:hypothetical protein
MIRDHDLNSHNDRIIATHLSLLSRREGLYLIMTIYVGLPGAGIPYDGGWPGKAGT